MKDNHSDKRIDVPIMKRYSNKKIDSMLAEYYTEEQVPKRVMQAISEGMDKIDEAQKNGAVNNNIDKIDKAQKNGAVNNNIDKIDEAQKNGTVNNNMDKIDEAQERGAVNNNMDKIDEAQERGTVNNNIDKIDEAQERGTVNNYMDKIDEAQKSGAINNYKENVRNVGRGSASTKTKKFSARAAIALAAAVILVCTVLQIGPVRAAVEKLFAFIPGVGMIEEEENSVMLYLDGRGLTKENEDISLCLDNAYVTDEGVQINYKLSLLGVPMDEADNLLAKGKDEAAYTDFLRKYNLTDYITIRNDDFISIKPDVELYVNNTVVEETSGAVAGGSVDMSGFSFYKLDTAAIDPSTKLSIKCGDLEISFNVKDYETYSSIDEIGATQCLNNVVITAVPRWSDKKLKVDIYSNNGSIFDGISGYGYYLYNRETESCDEKAQPYVTIGDLFLPLAPMSGFDGTTLEFDLTGVEITEEMKKKAVLHIPSVSLYNYEEKSVPVSIKKDKMLNEINKELQFEGGTLTVVSAEHVADFYADGKERSLDESNTLKLTLKFKPNESGTSLDSFGGIYYNSDNGFSWETDRQNNQIIAYIDYDKPYYKIKTLRFVNPVYIYYDEYELTLR